MLANPIESDISAKLPKRDAGFAAKLIFVQKYLKYENISFGAGLGAGDFQLWLILFLFTVIHEFGLFFSSLDAFFPERPKNLLSSTQSLLVMLWDAS